MKPLHPLPDVDELTRLHAEMVDRWHRHPVDNKYSGFLGLVCQQHASNFNLWHQEDCARDPSATDTEIAGVKRAIDKLNQTRNDLIEQLDDRISLMLDKEGIEASGAPMNTETVGSVIDRLSILALRLYHYREQADREDADEGHLQKVQPRIEQCERQHADLRCALSRLIQDLLEGKKRHQTYRQMKMYNDPTLNPLINKSE